RACRRGAGRPRRARSCSPAELYGGQAPAFLHGFLTRRITADVDAAEVRARDRRDPEPVRRGTRADRPRPDAAAAAGRWPAPGPPSALAPSHAAEPERVLADGGGAVAGRAELPAAVGVPAGRGRRRPGGRVDA